MPMGQEAAPPFESLEFLYTPSRDVAAEARHLAEVLGGRVTFAVEAMGTRAALVELTAGPPHLLLTDHLEGERPILVYRVTSLEHTMHDLEGRGWKRERTFEIPHGPCCSFRAPGGHRFAIFEAARPDATAHFAGRRDF
jgi:hypothetical protein